MVILLGSAWGMGGTIRTTLNLAGHLGRHRRVEILSILRSREEPFFPFPENVKVTAVGEAPRLLQPLARALSRRASVLIHPRDWLHPDASLWTDLALVHHLRGRTGYLIGTRPALNLVTAELPLRGLVRIGQEHMHLRAHDPALRRAMRHAYPRLDALVLLTERDRRRYEKVLGGQVRLARIPNALPRDLGPPAPLEGTTVLAAGRLTKQKGFDLLIRAFARVAPAHPDWRLVIFGEGPARERLERLVAKRGLNGAVTLPGPADPLSAEMDRAAMYVLSSRFEGFPMVLIEAMAKGLPVVAYRCPTGPGEVITDHHDGVLVKRESVRLLADAMAELMDDAELRRRLGAAAAVTAEDYKMERIGPRWDDLLEDLRRG